MGKTRKPPALPYVFETEFSRIKTRLSAIPGGLYSDYRLVKSPPFRVQLGKLKIHIHTVRAVLLIERALRGEPIDKLLKNHWTWDAKQHLLRIEADRNTTVCIERLTADDPATKRSCFDLRRDDESDVSEDIQSGDYRVTVNHQL